MADISVSALAMVRTSPEEARAAVTDYREVRPAILPRQFRDYQVLEGGSGAGSRVRWTLKPARWTKRGMRDWEVMVEESGGEIVERDTCSDVVATWTVLPGPDERSVVRVTLSSPSPPGLAGFRARSRAAKLQRIYGEVLLELHKRFAQ